MSPPAALPETLLGAEVVAAAPASLPGAPLLEMREDEFHIIAHGDHAWIDITGVGVFEIDRGRRVTVKAAPDAEPGVLEVYLSGTVDALLLAQRRSFALHANAVAIGDRGVLIAGDSGSGKSTTAIRMLQRGHGHVADDMCALGVEHGRVALDHPTARGLRVSPEAAESLQLDLAGASRPFPSSDKLVLPIQAGPPARPVAIAVLEIAASGGLAVRRVVGSEAVRHILAHVYRADVLLHIWPQELFDWAADVAAAVPVHVITRPAGVRTIDEVAAAVESLAAGG